MTSSQIFRPTYLAALLVFITVTTSAQNGSQKDYAGLIDHYMNAAVTVNQFSGSVLLAKQGHIIYEKTFGTLDYASTKRLDSNSMFELGEITEEFTAAAILLLKDQGKLKLTDAISKYLPQLPYNTVTIKDLLTHSAGLPDYYDEVMKNKWGTEKYATINDVIQSLAAAKVPLAWQPGTHYNEYHYYTEYPLLTAIVEKVSGETFSGFLQRHIFTPLHMQHTSLITGVKGKESEKSNYTESIFFDESKQQFLSADSFTYVGSEYSHVAKNIYGAKGISSTARDLFLWNKAMQQHTLLSAATQQEMFSPYILKDTASKIFMGYGILTGSNEFGKYVQQRDFGTNETLGYITTLIHYKIDDVTIIILANKPKASSNIAGPLAYILFNREVVPPYIHKAVTIDTALLVKYAGNYEVPYSIHAYKKENTLWITMPGEPDLKLLPESPTKFFSSSLEYDLQVEFKTDATGKVTNSYFINNGLKKEVKKIQ